MKKGDVLPSRSPGQGEQEFINVCMANPEVRGEFPKVGQRFAVCKSLAHKDSVEKVDRYDESAISELKKKHKGVVSKRQVTLDGEVKVDAWQETPQGFLKVKANLTRTGNFIYHDSKGNKIVEYRPPEEVFDPVSYQTLNSAPLTKNHPDWGVDKYNAKDLMKGFVAEDVAPNGQFLTAHIIVTDADEISYIKSRKKFSMPVELSCGYETAVYDVQGESEEGPYDKIQADIKYNHVAMVFKGRAGKDVKILDKADKASKSNKEDKMRFRIKGSKKLKIDGFTIDIADDSSDQAGKLVECLDDTITAMEKLDSDLAAKDSEVKELQGKLDQITGEKKALQEKVDELSDPNSKMNLDMLKDLSQVKDMAEKLKVELQDGEKAKSFHQLKVDVIDAIGKVLGIPAMSDEQKSDASYLKGRWEMAVAGFKGVAKSDALKDLSLLKAVTGNDDSETKSDEDSENPRDKYIKNNRDAWKTKEGGK